MRNLSTAINIILLLTTGASCMSCNTSSQDTNSVKILKIKIIDRTHVHYYANGNAIRDTLINDPNKIAEFQKQLNSIKEVLTVDVKYTFGFYEIIVYFSNNTKRNLGSIYTVYDGVIIYDYDTNKEYKNDYLEDFIRPYFDTRRN